MLCVVQVDFPTGDALLWGKHNHQLCQFETKSPQNPATKHNHQLCRFCQVASWISIYGCRKVVDSSANGENARKVAGLGGYLLQIMYQVTTEKSYEKNSFFLSEIRFGSRMQILPKSGPPHSLRMHTPSSRVLCLVFTRGTTFLNSKLAHAPDCINAVYMPVTGPA